MRTPDSQTLFSVEWTFCPPNSPVFFKIIFYPINYMIQYIVYFFQIQMGSAYGFSEATCIWLYAWHFTISPSSIPCCRNGHILVICIPQNLQLLCGTFTYSSDFPMRLLYFNMHHNHINMRDNFVHMLNRFQLCQHNYAVY